MAQNPRPFNGKLWVGNSRVSGLSGQKPFILLGQATQSRSALNASLATTVSRQAAGTTGSVTSISRRSTPHIFDQPRSNRRRIPYHQFPTDHITLPLMSLSALVNGADCGPVNPLRGLTKGLDADRGLAADLIRSSRAGSSKQVFNTSNATASSSIAIEAAQFFNRRDKMPVNQPLRPFDMSSFRQAFPAPLEAVATMGASEMSSSSWAADFKKGSEATNTISPLPAWTTDFGKQQNTPAATESTFQRRTYAPNLALMPNPMMMMRRPILPLQQWQQGSVAFDPAYDTRASTPLQNSDIDKHFQQLEDQNSSQRQLEANDLASTAGLLIDSLKSEKNAKFENSAFLGLMKQVRDHEAVISGNDIVPVSHLPPDEAFRHRLEKGKMRADGVVPSSRPKSVHFEDISAAPLATAEDFEDWEEGVAGPSLDRLGRARRVGLIEAQEAEWARLQEDWDAWEATPVGFHEVKPNILSYQFQARNPYIHRNTARYPARLVDVGRSLSDTILEQEARVQRNLHDADAWLSLGIKQQENEREAQAIAALSRAVELDPELLPAWLSLGISFTNEGNRHDAYHALQQWIIRNPVYKSISSSHNLEAVDESSYTSTRAWKEQLVDCLIDMATNGAHLSPGGIDPDVQIALAVVLNTGEDFTKAVDCFKAALEARPDDAVLYNRVGATLANSGQPEVALAYYQRALELNPTYIRARYNLGISCINLKRYDEAAAYMLDALVLQDTEAAQEGRAQDSRGVTSQSLWETLRTTCHHLHRQDLAGFCESRDLQGFQAAFQQ